MAAQTAGTTSEAMRYGWGYGHGVGFGFLGLLFPLLFIFLLIGLVRARWAGRAGVDPAGGTAARGQCSKSGTAMRT